MPGPVAGQQEQGGRAAQGGVCAAAREGGCSRRH